MVLDNDKWINLQSQHFFAFFFSCLVAHVVLILAFFFSLHILWIKLILLYFSSNSRKRHIGSGIWVKQQRGSGSFDVAQGLPASSNNQAVTNSLHFFVF